MVKGEIKPGQEYAYRETRGPGSPMQRVRVLEHVRGNKWKAEWIEPNPGLVDYVESSQLVVLWKDSRRFLKEEESADRLRKRNEEHGYVKNSPVVGAMDDVFESTGEQLTFHNGAAR